MKILIIRFSSIGDIVMTTPVIRCLKKQLGAEIFVATKKAFASITQENPYVSEVIALENDWNAFAKKVKVHQYDHVIDLHNNLRSKRLSRLLGAKSHRINKLSIQKTALIQFGINNLPNIHFAERALETVAFLDVKDDKEGMDFFIPSTINISDRLPLKRFATLALATAHATKNMPLDLIRSILDASPLPIVLLGGPAEAELGQTLAFDSVHINMAGACTLLESAAFVRESQFLISGDTGLLHIAAALKKPTVSIWGATIPEFGVFPYYGRYDVPHFIHEVSLKCRPCTKHGGPSCPKKHFNCMHLQDVPAILESIEALVNSKQQ